MPTERLSKRERDDLNEFAVIIRQVQRELAVTIKEALLSGDIERGATHRLHLARVVAVLDQMGAEIDPRARRIVADAFQRGSEKMARQILELRLPELPQVAVLGTGVAQEAVQVLQDAVVGRLKGAREAVGRQTQDLFAHAGRRAAIRALLGADPSPEKAGRRLAADLLKNKDVRKQVELTGRFKLTPDGRNWALPDYTDMVVRTTTREAVVQGSMLRMASNGVNLARVSTHASACPICQPFEGRLVSLDGRTTEYEGETAMDASVVPPFHPRCLAPGTMAHASGTYGAMRAWYSGDLVDLATVGGVRLSITPNHPVMTTAGWLAAGDLREGMRILRAAHGRPVSALARNHDLNDMPTAIEDVFETLGASGRCTAVAASGDDLHGDGGSVKGKVDVVLAYRQLLHELAFDLPQQRGEHVLVRADELQGALAGVGAAFEMFGGLARAAYGSMGGIRRRGPDRHAVTAQVLRHCAGGNVRVDREDIQSLSREIADGVSVDIGDRRYARRRGAHLLGSCPHGHAELLKLSAHASRARAELARQVAEGSASGVHADELVGVDRRAYAGHVYDLTVRDGHYEANTVIVSNCAHTLMPVAVRIEQIKRDLAGSRTNL